MTILISIGIILLLGLLGYLTVKKPEILVIMYFIMGFLALTYSVYFIRGKW